jgi:hypothetical protein
MGGPLGRGASGARDEMEKEVGAGQGGELSLSLHAYRGERGDRKWRACYRLGLS